MRFLVTRPEPECRLTADKLRAEGHLADEMPLLKLEASVPDRFELADVSALAITSARVPDLLRGHHQFGELMQLPVFTVGDKSAQAARTAGFKTVTSADGDVAALARIISENTAADVRLLYPAAHDRSGDLPGLLAKDGRHCTTIVIYRMGAKQKLPEAISNRLESGEYDGVLIFSRRTAEVFATLLERLDSKNRTGEPPVFAISKQAAEPLGALLRTEIPDFPREDVLLKLALTQR